MASFFDTKQDPEKEDPDHFDAYKTADGRDLPRVSSILNMLGDTEKMDRLRDWAASCSQRELRRLVLSQCDRKWTKERASADPVGAVVQAIREKVKGQSFEHTWQTDLKLYADAGTRAHAMIEQVLIAGMVGSGKLTAEQGKERTREIVEKLARPCTKKETNYAERAFANFCEWMNDHGDRGGFEPLAAEMRLVSEELGYGGTVDCVGRYQGKTLIVDFKTSSSLDRTRFGLQLSAYAALLETMTKHTVEGGMVLRVSRSFDEYEVETYTDAELVEFFGAFKLLRELYTMRESGVLSGGGGFL